MVTQADLRRARCGWDDPDGIMHRITRGALALVPAAEAAAVELVDADGDLVPVCVAGIDNWTPGRRLRRDACLSGITLSSGMPQRCDDAEQDPRVDLDACRSTNTRSLVCVPLLRGSRPVGVFSVHSSGTSAFGDAVVETLSELAGFLSTVIGTLVHLGEVAAAPGAVAPAGTRHQRERSPTGPDDGPAVALLDRPAMPGTPPFPMRPSPASDADRVAAFVSEVLQPGTADLMATRSRIEHVLASRALSLVFQPVIKLPRRTPVAVEALARFPGPPHQTPDVWFAEAHSVGLGVELELLAVEEALTVLRRLPANVLLGVNASPMAVASEGLEELLSVVDAGRVAIEITEHAAVEDYAYLRRRIAALRKLGARISIDDTGSGYASFRHILSLSPEFIKLDLALTRDIDRDPARRALATALVGFVEERGARLIAEGIETSGELATVEELGITFGQGYHLGRPVPFEDLDVPGLRR